MKPPIFSYVAPASLEECAALLAQYGDEAKVIAGGQSLMPLLNLRMVRPAVIVDIGRIRDLQRWEESQGQIRIGALVRQRSLESDKTLAQKLPLMAEAVEFVGHPATRSRGTIVGSLCHADPAAELPVCAALLGTQIHLRAAGGQRTVKADAFFVDALSTAVEEGEFVEAISTPSAPQGAGFAFAEIARRHGDFALVCVGAMVEAEAGVAKTARVALGGVGPRPAVFTLGDGGANPASRSAYAAFVRQVVERIEPASDLHATADYRRSIAGVLIERTLTVASDRAGVRS